MKNIAGTGLIPPRFLYDIVCQPGPYCPMGPILPRGYYRGQTAGNYGELGQITHSDTVIISTVQYGLFQETGYLMQYFYDIGITYMRSLSHDYHLNLGT